MVYSCIHQGTALTSGFAILVFSTALLIYPILCQELRSRRTNYATIPTLRRTPDNIILVYRTVEIFIKNLLIHVGPVILPMQGLLSQFILILNYMLVRHGHSMTLIVLMVALVWTAVCQIAWIIVLTLSATFQKGAVATIRSWKYFEFSSKFEKKYMNKFRKSCKPLCIGTKGVFRITKKTVLKFLQGIVRGTFRALITLK